jgi:hypothetical protein
MFSNGHGLSQISEDEVGDKHGPMFGGGHGLSQIDPFLEFTQVQQSSRWHSCQATFRRLENSIDDFQAILNGS